MNKWTEEENELLKLWCAEAWKYKDIAMELNRSYGSVAMQASKLKVSNNINTLKTTEQYIIELKTINSTLFPLETYKGANTKILHKCNSCGIQTYSRPHDKLQNKGCSICANNKRGSGIDLKTAGILYLVYFEDINLYKYGITGQTLNKRLSGIGYNYTCIFIREFNIGLDAVKLEKEWSINLSKFKINTGLLKSGNTETFRL